MSTTVSTRWDVEKCNSEEIGHPRLATVRISDSQTETMGRKMAWGGMSRSREGVKVMGCRGDALVCEKVRHWDACSRLGEGWVVLLIGLGLEKCESSAG